MSSGFRQVFVLVPTNCIPCKKSVNHEGNSTKFQISLQIESLKKESYMYTPMQQLSDGNDLFQGTRIVGTVGVTDIRKE